MTRKEKDNAIRIIQNEIVCVERQSSFDRCNRDCFNCDLVLHDREILWAYSMAIKAINSMSEETS